MMTVLQDPALLILFPSLWMGAGPELASLIGVFMNQGTEKLASLLWVLDVVWQRWRDAQQTPILIQKKRTAIKLLIFLMQELFLMKKHLSICDIALLERLKVKTKYKWLQSHALF